ncbi:MAG: DUF1599 domain-containing protein [Bacteroidia bacterium]|nr:DUF1599 domain-containing protein [Bacteroidia bacterium]
MIPPLYVEWQHKALSIFLQKKALYGESWRELSLPSFTDLLYIKASRIRTLLQGDSPSATGESPTADWLALVNYAALALAKLRDLEPQTALPQLYEEAQALLEKKNADYGDAWQHLRPLAFIEFILMKLARIRQMDSNPQSHALAITDNLFDVVNYALLYLSRYGDPLAAP